jgi:hypothetical protein
MKINPVFKEKDLIFLLKKYISFFFLFALQLERLPLKVLAKFSRKYSTSENTVTII